MGSGFVINVCHLVQLRKFTGVKNNRQPQRSCNAKVVEKKDNILSNSFIWWLSLCFIVRVQENAKVPSRTSGTQPVKLQFRTAEGFRNRNENSCLRFIQRLGPKYPGILKHTVVMTCHNYWSTGTYALSPLLWYKYVFFSIVSALFSASTPAQVNGRVSWFICAPNNLRAYFLSRPDYPNLDLKDTPEFWPAERTNMLKQAVMDWRFSHPTYRPSSVWWGCIVRVNP